MAIDPEVLLLPAFAAADLDTDALEGGPDEASAGPADEVARWLDHFAFTAESSVPGLPGPLRYDPDAGVALARTGIGKPAAAATVGALVASPAISLETAHVVSVGIAGCPPEAATIGSVFVADTVVDWDRKHRVDGEIHPLAWRTRDFAWALDADLVDRAARAAAATDLVDPESAQHLRARYDDDREPSVGVGPTVAGDDVWHGANAAAAVERLCAAYGVDGFVTTVMEESGTVQALERAGLLDRYCSVRAVSNFDRAPEGGDPLESMAWMDVETGVENAFRAGRAVVETIAAPD